MEKHIQKREIFYLMHATIACMKGLKYVLHCLNSPATYEYPLFLYFYQSDFF